MKFIKRSLQNRSRLDNPTITFDDDRDKTIFFLNDEEKTHHHIFIINT